MKNILEVINQMEADGVIGQYAIGGAVGATFYLEPVATLDVDVFVSFQQKSGSPLISLAPIYDYLTARGFKAEKEYIIIGGWPVQFCRRAARWWRRLWRRQWKQMLRACGRG